MSSTTANNQKKKAVPVQETGLGGCNAHSDAFATQTSRRLSLPLHCQCLCATPIGGSHLGRRTLAALGREHPSQSHQARVGRQSPRQVVLRLVQIRNRLPSTLGRQAVPKFFLHVAGTRSVLALSPKFIWRTRIAESRNRGIGHRKTEVSRQRRGDNRANNQAGSTVFCQLLCFCESGCGFLPCALSTRISHKRLREASKHAALPILAPHVKLHSRYRFRKSKSK